MTSSPQSGRTPVAFALAAWLLIAQSVLMELGAAVMLPVLLVIGVDQSAIGAHFSFIVPFFQEHLYLLMAMSGVFGVLRLVGAVAMLRDRLWGLGVSVVMCVVTLVLMIFMLPAGILDGMLSGGAIILILRGWFGSGRISQRVD
jgi:hypothetical protein